MMRFLDNDADGKLSAAEAGDRPFFKVADENQDGVVTREQLRGFLQRRATTTPDARR